MAIDRCTISEIERQLVPEHFKLYHLDHAGDWGFVHIMTGTIRETAHVMANTTYGNYGYYWNSTGPNPIKFLIEMDMDYGLKKMTGYDYKYADKRGRIEEVKQLIIECRKEKRIDNDDARDAWEELTVHVDWTRLEEVYEMVNHSYWFNLIFHSDPTLLPRRTVVKQECRGFWDHIWTPVMQRLKEDTQNG